MRAWSAACAAIATRYGLPAWSADDHTLHKQADRLAAASEALHVVGYTRQEIRDDLLTDLVPLSHCEFRRGYTGPSGFIADIPDKHRVQGWLRSQGEAQPRTVAVRFLDDLDDADLLRHF